MTLSLAPSRQSRRTFLAGAASAIISAAAAPSLFSADAPADKPLVGSNVYGWTQYAQRDNKPFNIADVISALADNGYDYLESFMDLGAPENNARLADQFRARGLQPVSIYTGGRLHEAAAAPATVARILVAAKVCRKAGFSIISCNPDPIGREKTDDELKTQVASLTELGKGLNDLGMKLAIHHHLPEMQNNAREFHYVFRNSAPEVVGFCYDVHWVWKGGVQPVEAIKAYSNRIVTWHLRQSRGGVWWEDLDTGDIDYAAIARTLNELELPRRLTVELAIEGRTQITRTAVENHRRSREFVRKTFGL